MRQRDFTTAEIAALITDVRGASCRSSYERGCRCPVHGDASAAPQVKAARLVAVADERGVTYAGCDESMTCSCQRCSEQRALLVQHPRHTPRQPWQPLHAAA